MSTGIGGKMRSRLTTVDWLIPGVSGGAGVGERWHFPLPDLVGQSAGSSSDSGTAAGVTLRPSSMPWGRLAAALGYGYGLYWIAKIEGIPTLFLEARADAIAPDGYDLDPSLVIDRCARLGSVVEGESHIAKAFDAELRFLDSPIVRLYQQSPARIATLTADFNADDTSIYMPTADFVGLDEFYIGASCIRTASRQADRFSLLSHPYGRKRSYRKGAIVTDSPRYWEGRRVDIYAVLIDPSGRYVQTDHILSDACLFWTGFVDARPVRDATEWVMPVRDQVRRIADPIGVAASGKALLTEDDPLLRVPRRMRWSCKAELQPTTNTILDIQIAPFDAYPEGALARASELRTAVLDAATAAATIVTLPADGVLGFSWMRELWGDANNWVFLVRINPDATDNRFSVLDAQLSNHEDIFKREAIQGYTVPVHGLQLSTIVPLAMPMRQLQAAEGISSVSVLLDAGTAADIPPTGTIVIEASGFVDYAKYIQVVTDAIDTRIVHVVLDTSERIVGAALESLRAEDLESAATVRFLWSDRGSLADILRRAIASTGDAQHGTWDTLPRGQGLGIADLDEDSFEDVFGAIADFDFQIASDASTSLAKHFEGVFRFSRRGLMTRRRDDGSAVELAAVDLGSIDSGVPVATITDAMLVSSAGRRPVRTKATFATPQNIVATCRTIAVGTAPPAEGTIDFPDRHLLDWTSVVWDLDIYGISRDTLKSIGQAWATSWYRAGETRQIIEIDLPPTVTAQGGDVVRIESTDASIWDYALGEAGYTGFARVLGAVIDPATAIVTLTVAVDGVLSSGPMSPSLRIRGVAGGGSTPTSIDVDEAHYELLVRARGAATSWKLLAYRPGQDSGRAEYTLSDVTLPGAGVARLTVVAYPTSPSVALTTKWNFTYPQASACTPEQGAHLHNTDVVQWS